MARIVSASAMVAPSSHDSRSSPFRSSPRERALLGSFVDLAGDVPQRPDAEEYSDRKRRPERHFEQRDGEEQPQQGAGAVSGGHPGRTARRTPQGPVHCRMDAKTYQSSGRGMIQSGKFNC